MMRVMSRLAISIAAIAHAPIDRVPQEFLRSFVVIGCALSLIAAGHALPF